MAKGKFRNWAGEVVEAWTVGSEYRSVASGLQAKIEWLCTCWCGEQKWVQAALLAQGRGGRGCGGPAHRRGVGDIMGDMVVVGLDEVRKEATLRCVCGRLVVYRAATYALWAWERSARLTCGCNGLDRIRVRGNPDLPKGVDSYNALIRWAGCSRQAHYQMIHRLGLRGAVEHLAGLAEKSHPGVGRKTILKVVPIPK